MRIRVAGKNLAAPFAFYFAACACGCPQVASAVAVFPGASFLALKLPTAMQTYAQRRFSRVCFVIFPPPLNPAFIAAETAMAAPSPLLIKFSAAIRTNTGFPSRCGGFSLFLRFLVVVRTAASFAAKTPALAFVKSKLYCLPTIWALIWLGAVIPLCVVITNPALVTAKLLAARMARWFKCSTAVLAVVFLVYFNHLLLPSLPFWGGQR
jgi:hypothetical protein